jgi:transcriptional regulator with XRE-family HTH domain
VSDLTAKEQRHVRTALRFLRLRVGAWAPLAEALGCKPDSIEKVVNGRRTVTPRLAFRVARIVDVPIEDLLAGTWISPRTCPHCGHPPDDFQDEETVVDDGQKKPALKIVK